MTPTITSLLLSKCRATPRSAKSMVQLALGAKILRGAWATPQSLPTMSGAVPLPGDDQVRAVADGAAVMQAHLPRDAVDLGLQGETLDGGWVHARRQQGAQHRLAGPTAWAALRVAAQPCLHRRRR